jgi:hypothetical protein
LSGACSKGAARLGLPAIAAAFAGAQVLVWISGLEPWIHHRLGAREADVTPIELVIAVLMLGFTLLELCAGRMEPPRRPQEPKLSRSHA